MLLCSGQIPTEFGNLAEVYALQLYENSLAGVCQYFDEISIIQAVIRIYSSRFECVL